MAMNINRFVVQRKEKREAIDTTWTTPVPRRVKETLRDLPKQKRLDVYESTRKFLNHLIEVYKDSKQDSSESA